MNAMPGAAAQAGSNAAAAILIVILLMWSVYLLPSIIALAKRNRRTKVILFNIFLGWTIVMWIICLVWACKREEEEVPAIIAAGLSPAEELKKYKELLDSGAITEAEYEEKKEKLLNL